MPTVQREALILMSDDGTQLKKISNPIDSLPPRPGYQLGPVPYAAVLGEIPDGRLLFSRHLIKVEKNRVVDGIEVFYFLNVATGKYEESSGHVGGNCIANDLPGADSFVCFDYYNPQRPAVTSLELINGTSLTSAKIEVQPPTTGDKRNAGFNLVGWVR